MKLLLHNDYLYVSVGAKAVGKPQIMVYEYVKQEGPDVEVVITEMAKDMPGISLPQIQEACGVLSVKGLLEYNADKTAVHLPK